MISAYKAKQKTKQARAQSQDFADLCKLIKKAIKAGHYEIEPTQAYYLTYTEVQFLVNLGYSVDNDNDDDMVEKVSWENA